MMINPVVVIKKASHVRYSFMYGKGKRIKNKEVDLILTRADEDDDFFADIYDAVADILHWVPINDIGVFVDVDQIDYTDDSDVDCILVKLTMNNSVELRPELLSDLNGVIEPTIRKFIKRNGLKGFKQPVKIRGIVTSDLITEYE